MIGDGTGYCLCNASTCEFSVQLDRCREFQLDPCARGDIAMIALVVGALSILASIIIRLYHPERHGTLYA